MKKMKALISALLVTAMSLSLFACGEEGKSSESYKELDSSKRE